MRKLLLIAAVGATLAGCSGSGTTPTATETLQQIHDQVVAACKFDATITSIAQVAATVASVVDPAAGATAQVAVAVGSTIVGDICKAVQAQQARDSAAKKGSLKAGETLDVVVNGVTVQGKVVP